MNVVCTCDDGRRKHTLTGPPKLLLVSRNRLFSQIQQEQDTNRGHSSPCTVWLCVPLLFRQSRCSVTTHLGTVQEPDFIPSSTSYSPKIRRSSIGVLFWDHSLVGCSNRPFTHYLVVSCLYVIYTTSPDCFTGITNRLFAQLLQPDHLLPLSQRRLAGLTRPLEDLWWVIWR